jgi:4a-hydroxytetrahydrobiopterin dehydratase
MMSDGPMMKTTTPRSPIEGVLMTTRRLLGPDELRECLRKLSGWKKRKGKLHQEYKFGTFAKAFGFMKKVAVVAEAMSHHPEWFNVYDTVRVDLVTHDLEGISTYDVLLAEKMNALARH